MTRREVLAITTSPLPYEGQITDGPGYRMWNLLQEIAGEHSVRIISLYESFHEGRRNLEPVVEGSMTIERPSHSPRGVQQRIRDLEPDVLYLPWSSTVFLGTVNRKIPTILDYVGPGLLEDFVANGHVSLPLLRVNLESFRYGDYYITTSEKERLYLIGTLAASGRLSEGTFQRDDPLVHVVRMTPPASPPAAEKLLPKRQGNELVVLLPGSFLPWYDYSMLASALGLIHARAENPIRLVVLGGNPRMPEVEASVRKTLSQGHLRGIVVFTGVVPFSRRAEYYLGADAALSIAPKSVEDELSSRTRIVDALWARLPLVTSGRDEYSALALEAGAAFRYDPDPQSLAATLERIADDRGLLKKARGQIERLLSGPLSGAAAARPVLGFIDSPYLTDRRSEDSGLASIAAMWVRDLWKALVTGRM